VLQLYDNSVFMVGGPGGERHHPVWDQKGIYHIDGRLVVANKDTVKELTALLLPLLKMIGASMKLVLAPLSHYWLVPCCDDEDHVVGHNSSAYIMTESMHWEGYIRNCLFTPKIANY
jgi:hypothetical protein